MGESKEETDNIDEQRPDLIIDLATELPAEQKELLQRFSHMVDHDPDALRWWLGFYQGNPEAAEVLTEQLKLNPEGTLESIVVWEKLLETGAWQQLTFDENSTQKISKSKTLETAKKAAANAPDHEKPSRTKSFRAARIVSFLDLRLAHDRRVAQKQAEESQGVELPDTGTEGP